MQQVRFFRYVCAMLAFVVAANSIAQAQSVLLDGATFGNVPTRPLALSIGRSARVSVNAMKKVGGVAFVREAKGQNGWSVTALHYNKRVPDGQRLSITLARHGGDPMTVQPRIYDWEFLPVARFVAGKGDSAFSYFGEYDEPGSSGTPNLTPVAYHPAFKDTLLGLRLMQLDLMMFNNAFTGYFKNADGRILLGGGETAVFGLNVDLGNKAVVSKLARRNYLNMVRAARFLASDCKRNVSQACIQNGQPHYSYVVGDLMTPVNFSVSNGELRFNDGPVCWQLWRDSELGDEGDARLKVRGEDLGDGNGETKVSILIELSRSYCEHVRMNLNGIHPLAYRSAIRTMRYSALMRTFNRTNRAEFGTFVASFAGVQPRPIVETPTEVEK